MMTWISRLNFFFLLKKTGEFFYFFLMKIFIRKIFLIIEFNEFSVVIQRIKSIDEHCFVVSS